MGKDVPAVEDDDGAVAKDEPVDTTLEDDDGKTAGSVLLLHGALLALVADVPAVVALLELVPLDMVPVLVVTPLCVDVVGEWPLADADVLAAGPEVARLVVPDDHAPVVSEVAAPSVSTGDASGGVDKDVHPARTSRRPTA